MNFFLIREKLISFIITIRDNYKMCLINILNDRLRRRFIKTLSILLLL